MKYNFFVGRSDYLQEVSSKQKINSQFFEIFVLFGLSMLIISCRKLSGFLRLTIIIDSGPTNGQNRERPNSKWMAKFLSFPKQRMTMAIHQIGKILKGELPFKTLSLAHPNAYLERTLTQFGPDQIILVRKWPYPLIRTDPYPSFKNVQTQILNWLWP